MGGPRLRRLRVKDRPRVEGEAAARADGQCVDGGQQEQLDGGPAYDLAVSWHWEGRTAIPDQRRAGAEASALNTRPHIEREPQVEPLTASRRTACRPSF